MRKHEYFFFTSDIFRMNASAHVVTRNRFEAAWKFLS